MTLKLLVDTCVWLDLAKDYREQPVIGAIEDLLKHVSWSLLCQAPSWMNSIATRAA